MELKKVKAAVHKHLDSLINSPTFPLEFKSRLREIRDDLDKSKNNVEIVKSVEELRDLSENAKLTRKQKGDVYSPVCWIEDYLIEIGYKPQNNSKASKP